MRKQSTRMHTNLKALVSYSLSFGNKYIAMLRIVKKSNVNILAATNIISRDKALIAQYSGIRVRNIRITTAVFEQILVYRLENSCLNIMIIKISN